MRSLFYFFCIALVISTGIASAVDVGAGSSSDIYYAIKRFWSTEILNKDASLSNWGKWIDNNGHKMIDLDGNGDMESYIPEGTIERTDPLYQVHHYAALTILLERELKRLGIYPETKAKVDAIDYRAIEEIDELRHLPADAAVDFFVRNYTKGMEGDSIYESVKKEMVSAANIALIAKYHDPPVTFTLGHAIPRGAGEVEAKIETKPSVAHVKIIPLFYFDLCTARKLNPWDSESCYGWREVVSLVVSLAGAYKYQARWPDGIVTKGEFVMDSRPFGEEGEGPGATPFLLTIKR